MRTSSAAQVLFPRARRAILGATLLHPERSWYLRELASHLAMTPSSLQRELKALVEVGILRQRREGKHVYFQAEANSPIFSELRGIMLKTAGLVDVIRSLLKPFRKRIKVAFIYGSIASNEEHAASDVDLMIVGDVELAELSPALRKAERIIARQINPTVYSLEELCKRVRNGGHFISQVVNSPKLIIQGNLDELVNTCRE